jgi:hypothetical protein
MAALTRTTPYMKIAYRLEGLTPDDNVFIQQMEDTDAAILYALQAGGIVINDHDFFWTPGTDTLQFDKLRLTAPFAGGTFEASRLTAPFAGGTFEASGTINITGLTDGKCAYMRVPLGLWDSDLIRSPSDFFVQDQYLTIQKTIVLLGIRKGLAFHVAIPDADRLT